MSLEELLRDRLIRKIRVDKNLVRKSFLIAKRDLNTAEKVFESRSYSWSLAIAYNSMLQAGRALMFLNGFKPTNRYQHIAVVKFVHIVFGKEITDRMINIFDRLREKRHKVVYEEVDIISEDEARNAIEWAHEFVSKVEEILRRKKII
ncbi:MAG: HEPN domain-containing protein [Candidatus Aenigmatarchaeota archaeon]